MTPEYPGLFPIPNIRDKRLPEILASNYFQKAFTGNGTDHMNINLIDLEKGGFHV